MDRNLRRENVEREDLVLFINACFACTRQQEFYSGRGQQAVSIEFLHSYIMGNYRRLYARCLAGGINHFNQGLILFNLLSTGAPGPGADRVEEGALIAAALRALPPQRALRLFRDLRDRRVNNRRTRAAISRYLRVRPDPAFDAVKYRAKVRAAASHAHLRLEGELGPFLFDLGRQSSFETPLFDHFRQARYSKAALYELPYSVAEGLAARHGIARDEFLAKIGQRMTVQEKLRLQRSGEAQGVKIDPSKLHLAGLTRLALYAVALKPEERQQRRDQLQAALGAAARRCLRRAPLKLGRVAAVLDASYSSSGSSEKRRRPLGVALAASALLREASDAYRAFWTPPREEELLVQARGQTDLATPLLDALEWEPELVIIVSDGFENSPPSGCAEVARKFRAELDPHGRTEMVHLNPVFDAQNFAPRTIGPAIPTVGVRAAEDIPTMLGFARFASGGAPLSELEDYLAFRMKEMLEQGQDRGGSSGQG